MGLKVLSSHLATHRREVVESIPLPLWTSPNPWPGTHVHTKLNPPMCTLAASSLASSAPHQASSPRETWMLTDENWIL